MKKSCFLITPIGESGSLIRRRVDQWDNLIYKKALGKEYRLIRADKIAAPGIITQQILEHIIKSELVIIDYTDLNPNVMYEAAIRHISRNPFIQINPINQTLPFDIKGLRSIFYDPNDLTYFTYLKKQIQLSIKEINSEGYKVPELLPQTFDLENIVKDPYKFVELLKEHLTPTNSGYFSPATTYNPTSYSGDNGYQGILNTHSHTIPAHNQYGSFNNGSLISNIFPSSCPNCSTTDISPIANWNGYVSSYKCNSCGIIFS